MSEAYYKDNFKVIAIETEHNSITTGKSYLVLRICELEYGYYYYLIEDDSGYYKWQKT